MKEFLVFIGENASTGKPNKQTGMYSFYGGIKKFKTASDRQCFLDGLSLPYGKFAVKGTRRTLRKYDLGSTVRKYNDWIDELPYTIYVGDIESGRAWEEV